MITTTRPRSSRHAASAHGKVTPTREWTRLNVLPYKRSRIEVGCARAEFNGTAGRSLSVASPAMAQLTQF
jgi:hypothetical protein